MIEDIIKESIKEFCLEFLQSPYLCYTEHGLHALFYCRLYSKIPEGERYIQCDGKKVCIIQKEYPTAGKLDKSRRQHWDIAVIQSPSSTVLEKYPPYDYLTLNSVVEFGLNVPEEHLRGDIERLSHGESNVKNKYIIHLYRISESESKRDISSKSGQLKELTADKILNMVKETDVNVYWGRADFSDNHKSELWLINNKKGKTRIK